MGWISDFKVKWVAAYYIATASKIVPVHKLTLRRMTLELHRYAGLAEGLAQLPLPDRVRLAGRWYGVPADIDTLAGNLTYGQRMYLTEQEGYDVGIILRLVAGYYYPICTGKVWDEKKAMQFGKNVLNSLVIELYPLATHLTALMEQLVTRERKLLQRTPSKQEKAAGIDKLAVFADLTAVLFLQESFRCTAEQVMLLPYNDCLVRFMLAKEQAAFKDRLTEVYRNESKAKK